MNICIHPTNEPARLINVAKVECLICGGKLKVTDPTRGMIEPCLKRECVVTDKQQGAKVLFRNGIKMIKEFQLVEYARQS